MAYVMGTVAPGTPTDTGVILNWGAASGGTGPYSYKVYRSTATGFTPGAGNLIATLGVGILTYTDSGLIPNTQYYYVVRSVDTGNGNATADATQVGALTAPQSISLNQFAQTPYIGVLDQSYNYDTQNVIVDPTLALTTKVYPGMAVKKVNPSGEAGNQTPMITPCTSAADAIAGFVQYSIKDSFFTAGMQCTISQKGNVQYLFATANGNVDDYGEIDLATVGGVKTGTPSDANIVAVQFIDQPVQGQLVRCSILVPTRSVF